MSRFTPRPEDNITFTDGKTGKRTAINTAEELNSHTPGADQYDKLTREQLLSEVKMENRIAIDLENQCAEQKQKTQEATQDAAFWSGQYSATRQLWEQTAAKLKATQEFYNVIMEKLRACGNRHGAPLGCDFTDFVIAMLDETAAERDRLRANEAGMRACILGLQAKCDELRAAANYGKELLGKIPGFGNGIGTDVSKAELAALLNMLSVATR